MCSFGKVGDGWIVEIVNSLWSGKRNPFPLYVWLPSSPLPPPVYAVKPYKIILRNNRESQLLRMLFFFFKKKSSMFHTSSLPAFQFCFSHNLTRLFRLETFQQNGILFKFQKTLSVDSLLFTFLTFISFVAKHITNRSSISCFPFLLIL